MTEQIEQLNNILIEKLDSPRYKQYPRGLPVPDIIMLWYIKRVV